MHSTLGSHPTRRLRPRREVRQACRCNASGDTPQGHCSIHTALVGPLSYPAGSPVLLPPAAFGRRRRAAGPHWRASDPNEGKLRSGLGGPRGPARPARPRGFRFAGSRPRTRGPVGQSELETLRGDRRCDRFEPSTGGKLWQCRRIYSEGGSHLKRCCRSRARLIRVAAGLAPAGALGRVPLGAA